MSKAAELAALIGSQTALSNRNFVINGAMQISQRATSVTGIGTTDTSGTYHTLDRFVVLANNTAGRLTMSQSTVTDLPGFANALKLDCTTADTSIAADEYFLFATRLEAQNLQSLKKGTSSAEPVTVSFYVKGNANATYVLEIFDNDNSRTINKTFSVTSSWNRVSITFPGDTGGSGLGDDTDIGLQLVFWLHAGSNSTSGSLQTSWGAYTQANRAVGISSIVDSTDRTLEITGLQMEIGEVATAFEHEDFGTTLYKCQRYFENLTFANATVITIGQVYSSATDAAGDLRYNVQKRDTPTIGVPSVGRSSGNINFLNNNAGFVATSDGTVTAVYISIDSCMLFGDNYNAFGAAGDASWLYSYGTNTFTIDAEL
jgi:hypothetical protein|tara:strand:- start:7427 stop:8545 length:1119 start_codon:yes stop_codon:yes gene_type:complete